MRALLAYGICCLALATFTAVRSAGLGSLWSSDPSLLPGLLVLALAGVGVTRAAWSLGRSAWHSAAVARHIRRHRVAAPPRLATWQGNLSDRLITLDAGAPYALTYGALRPRILVTTGLLRTLSDAELAAVLTHEQEHLRSRDPLKNVLARAILARHFYLPALTGLRDRFTSGRELSADRAAIATHGVRALAGALLKVTERPSWAAASPSAAMSTKALLEARIRQLETGTEPRHPPAGHHRVLPTLVAALLLGPAFIWSAVIVVHYLPQCIPGLR
jgi:Zn-dependent protease with chaperone function